MLLDYCCSDSYCSYSNSLFVQLVKAKTADRHESTTTLAAVHQEASVPAHKPATACSESSESYASSRGSENLFRLTVALAFALLRRLTGASDADFGGEEDSGEGEVT